METGIPGLRGGDHVGITVPDIEQAHAFFVDVLGFDYVYSCLLYTSPSPRD